MRTLSAAANLISARCAFFGPNRNFRIISAAKRFSCSKACSTLPDESIKRIKSIRHPGLNVVVGDENVLEVVDCVDVDEDIIDGRGERVL